MTVLETFTGLTTLEVDPVQWARSQMAFTLGFHIILVPLGAWWAFMTLIANFRAIRRNDRAGLLPAQRWSRQPLLDSPPPVQAYAPGSWGPAAADQLVAEQGGWQGPWIV